MYGFFEGKLLKMFYENCSLVVRILLRKDNLRIVNLVEENKIRKKMYEEKLMLKRSIVCVWYNVLVV